MTTRVLPVEEWGRLAGGDLDALWAQFDPMRTEILVVEDQGQIVGHLLRLIVDHVDGAWIHPDYRKGEATLRLWRGMRHRIAASGARTFLTAADRPDTMQMFKRAQLLPAQEYVICLQS